MSKPSTDNCYGDAQLPSCPEELANRLRQLRAERSDQGRLSKMPSRAKAHQRAEILKKTGSRCHICGGSIDGYWEADHVFPAAAGGDEKTDNFLAAHGLCNGVKSNHRQEEFQWVLKIGVWAKKQMEGKTALGTQILTLFWEHERRRKENQKTNLNH